MIAAIPIENALMLQSSLMQQMHTKCNKQMQTKKENKIQKTKNKQKKN